MFYRVTARLRTETGADFLRKLTDGTIESQSPDGREIVDAMNRAVLSDDGNVSWSEVCYCRTPLAHERATVFDKHFEALDTEVIEGYQNYDGRSFMEYLAHRRASLHNPQDFPMPRLHERGQYFVAITPR